MSNTTEDMNATQTNYLNEALLSTLLSAFSKNYSSQIKDTFVNNIFKILPTSSIEEFTQWIGQSSEVLKSNKNIIQYGLNTMTNENAQALGTVSSMDTTTTSNDHILTRQKHLNTLASEPGTTVLTSDCGFDVVKKEINKLLVDRLSDSMGKQSPINGKTLDTRSFFDLNVLPVIKNGSLTKCHRVLETTLEMMNNMHWSFDSNDKGTFLMISSINPIQLESDTVKDLLEKPKYTTNTTQHTIYEMNLVSKALQAKDAGRDIQAMAAGSLAVLPSNISGSTATSAGFTYLNVFNWPGYKLETIDNYYDLSPCALEIGYGYQFYIPFASVNNGNGNAVNNTTDLMIYTDNGNGHQQARLIRATFTNNAAREAVKAQIKKELSANDYTTVNLLVPNNITGNASITIGSTTYTATLSSDNSWGNNYLKSRLGEGYVSDYHAFENQADIVNAVDTISKLTSANIYKSSNTAYSQATLDRHTPGTAAYVMEQSSIWGRIALVAGQLEYKYDRVYDIGNETLISNKVFNYSYFRNGLLLKYITTTYGSIYNRNIILPSDARYIEITNMDVLRLKENDIVELIPLFTHAANNITMIENYISNPSGLYVCDYYTEARWWRYDYFGGFDNIKAPKQKLTMNTIDQDYSEEDDEIFVNSGRSIGSITYRFGPNGSFTQGSLTALTFCPNTAIKMKMPHIFKKKRYVKTVLVHGLDLINTTNSPVWYAPYYAKYTLEDKGSYTHDVVGDLFN